MSTLNRKADNSGTRIEHRGLGLRGIESDAVWRLLAAADGEFVPPLSSRRSPTQGDLGEAPLDPDGPRRYFEEISGQRFLLAFDEGSVSGFMSYREDSDLPRDSQSGKGLPTSYVTTVIVNPECRGRGITRSMYRSLFEIAQEAGRTVSTRTWSGNESHLSILRSEGFRLVHLLPDDRGPGMDTVYYERQQG